MIEVRHIRKEYENTVPLVDINTTINDGDIISIIGPSGVGKSTFLRCINLLETPTSGQIIIDGTDITDPKCDIDKMRLKVGMVFQSFNLYNHLTVIENIMLAQTWLLGRSRQEAYDKGMELLKTVGLEDYALQYPDRLSGGQKQRVAIARTLATDPEVILLDEPTSALDPKMVKEVQNVIVKLAEQGHTMVIVTHEMELAKKISTRVLYVDDGIIYEEGSPEEIFGNPQKEKTKKFVSDLSTLDFVITGGAFDLSEATSDIFNFCTRFGVDASTVVKIETVFEKLCMAALAENIGDDEKIHVSLMYSEKNKDIELTILHNGNNKISNKIENDDIKKIIKEPVNIDGKDFEKITVKFTGGME